MSWGEGRLRSQGWDTLIAHLSAGLLYGREVKKPAWYTTQRKRPFFKRPALPRSESQQRILPFLLDTDLAPKQIAKLLHLNPTSVSVWIHRIYKHHDVATRQELRQKSAPQRSATMKLTG